MDRLTFTLPPMCVCICPYIQYIYNLIKSHINHGTRKATKNKWTHTSIGSRLSFSVIHKEPLYVNYKINTEHGSLDMHQLINRELLSVLFIK